MSRRCRPFLPRIEVGVVLGSAAGIRHISIRVQRDSETGMVDAAIRPFGVAGIGFEVSTRGNNRGGSRSTAWNRGCGRAPVTGIGLPAFHFGGQQGITRAI